LEEELKETSVSTASSTEDGFTVEEAKKGGVNEVSHFESKKELADRLMEYSASGDMILVKGSRGMKMEDVIGYMSGESI